MADYKDRIVCVCVCVPCREERREKERGLSSNNSSFFSSRPFNVSLTTFRILFVQGRRRFFFFLSPKNFAVLLFFYFFVRLRTAQIGDHLGWLSRRALRDPQRRPFPSDSAESQKYLN
jgi:hypothetical protein